MNTPNFVQATTTADSEEESIRLANSIVESRLAACVQIVGPIRSIYWWDNTVTRSQEWQIIAKTSGASADRLVAHILEQHSYETPEIVITPIIGGSDDYLNWISEETRQTDASS